MGKNQVSYYTNDKGQVIHVFGEDEEFIIVGKNLDHTVDVYCREINGGDSVGDLGSPWDNLTNWTYGPTSKSLVDAEADDDCAGGRSAIVVQFDNKTPGDTSDDIFVQGPEITFKQVS